MGETLAGVERLKQAARAAERVVAQDPANAFTRNELAMIYTNLGSTLRESGQGAPEAAEGCQFLERAVKLWEALQSEGRSSGETGADRERAVAQFSRCPGRGRLSGLRRTSQAWSLAWSYQSRRRQQTQEP